jgi:RNA polymerase sigma factor (sigma-70 family)
MTAAFFYFKARAPPFFIRFWMFQKNRMEERQMQNWQKTRNYRKFENADGSFRHIITVDGTDVEVSREVYEAYSQGDRRERYQSERDAGRMFSLERMDEDDVQLSYLTDRHIESAEDSAIREILSRQAVAALSLLNPEERQLIQAVVMEGVPENDYAATIGVVQSTVHKRKKRLLKKIFNLLELNPLQIGWESEGV